jgi:Family of unknown function (DUF6932)
MAIPDFRDDGYLPVGVHRATEDEVRKRFGISTPRRIYLMGRVSRWLTLARVVGAERFLVDGSFITAKPEPNDVDCVCWLPTSFEQQYQDGRHEALELQETIYRREPKEIFDCESLSQWNEWVTFFSRTREDDDRQKGIIEVVI